MVDDVEVCQVAKDTAVLVAFGVVSSFQTWATRDSFYTSMALSQGSSDQHCLLFMSDNGRWIYLLRRIPSYCTIAWRIFAPGFLWRIPMKFRYVSGVDYNCWGFAVCFQLCSRCRRVRSVGMLGVVSALLVTSRREGERRLRVRNIYACPTRSYLKAEASKVGCQENVCVATEQILKG